VEKHGHGSGPGITKKASENSYRANAPAEIGVFVNNHLGIRTEIQCSRSDTIREFKLLAAVYLGIRPGAMSLKRQGRRPLKDYLPLEEYEIEDGSSLDLEVETGD